MLSRLSGEIDLYCERLGPGLWAEPLNASTNLAFLIAAWVSWQLAFHSGIRASSVGALNALMVTIGVGSALFHTVATVWAQVLDVLPILIFQIYFFWLYFRRVASGGSFSAALLVVGFLIATLFGKQFPAIVNGSLAYIPAVVVLIGLGVHHYKANKRDRSGMLAASGVFVLALFFRTIDQAVCPGIPWGTHFLWHVSIAVAAYLAMRGLILNW